MRLHRDIIDLLPLNMINPTIRYPYALPTALATWYVYLRDEGHSIMVIPRTHYDTDAPCDNLIAIPVRSALTVPWQIGPTGHVVADLLVRSGRVVIDDDDFEYQ